MRRAQRARTLFRFRLRTITIVLTILVIALGLFSYYLHAATRQRKAVFALEQVGCEVYYTYHTNALKRYEQQIESGDLPYGYVLDNATPYGMPFLVRWLGVDFFNSVDEIYWDDDLEEYDRVLPEDESLQFGINECKYLQHLRGLRILYLFGADLNNESITYISQMTSLRKMRLRNSIQEATNLDPLRNLTKLEYLDLSKNDLGLHELMLFLGDLKQLRSLDLHSTNVDDQIITVLTSLESLDMLDLRDTKVTVTETSKLTELHKHLNVRIMNGTGLKLAD